MKISSILDYFHQYYVLESTNRFNFEKNINIGSNAT